MIIDFGILSPMLDAQNEGVVVMASGGLLPNNPSTPARPLYTLTSDSRPGMVAMSSTRPLYQQTSV